MRIISLHTTLIAGAFMALGLTLASGAHADQSRFCQTGTLSSAQERIDCASRWVAADGTPLGPQIDPRETPKTPHPGFRNTRSSGYAHSTAQSTLYATHASHMPTNVWTPPEPYYATGAPVVVTRGNQTNAYDGSYDVYVPTRPARPYQGSCGHRVDGRYDTTTVLCGNKTVSAPVEGCFTLDATGRSHPVACPVSDTLVSSSTSYAPASRAVAHASANASASASVNISSAGFFNTLSGGVGVGAPVFYGGGGGASFTSGGGSVLSRSPLIRFRSRNRGGHKGGHGGCGCGGGMMGMGGGD